MKYCTVILLLLISNFGFCQCNELAKFDMSKEGICLAVKTMDFFNTRLSEGEGAYMLKVIVGDTCKDIVWIEGVQLFQDTMYQGLVYSESEFLPNLKIGTQIQVTKDKVLDWFYSENDNGKSIVYGWFSDGNINVGDKNKYPDLFAKYQKYEGYCERIHRAKIMSEVNSLLMEMKIPDGLISYPNPQNPPTYPGGEMELYKYLGREMKMPEEAIKNKANGEVFVGFAVNPAGEIIHPQILKGMGFGCDEEALRLVEKMGNWIPAKDNGQKVRALHSIAIKFKVQ